MIEIVFDLGELGGETRLEPRREIALGQTHEPGAKRLHGGALYGCGLRLLARRPFALGVRGGARPLRLRFELSPLDRVGLEDLDGARQVAHFIALVGMRHDDGEVALRQLAGRDRHAGDRPPNAADDEKRNQKRQSRAARGDSGAHRHGESGGALDQVLSVVRRLAVRSGEVAEAPHDLVAHPAHVGQRGGAAGVARRLGEALVDAELFDRSSERVECSQ